MNKKTVVIIGAGPAGLTAAYELLKYPDYQVIIIEKNNYVGGISCTINYKNNRLDIGGHRFFSKSDRVMQWWQDIMPELLERNRKSRILFMRTFFDYPLTVSLKLFYKLGFIRSCKIGFSYLWRALFPLKKEKTLEQFYINRFGHELYATFFRDYTYKVWGRPCSQMSADWGAQRAKELSVLQAVIDSIKRLVPTKKNITQKNIQTSLITRFLYPPLGPGQLWERVAEKIQLNGGILYLNHELINIHAENNAVTKIGIRDQNNHTKNIACDYLISSMPIKDLVNTMDDKKIPSVIRELANQLPYRDFLTVGILINKKLELDDNWIYIQEPDITMGRIQIFNNWSPHMVNNPNTTWLGLEYFCTECDNLWNTPNNQLISFATQELVKIGLVQAQDVTDGTVIRIQKAYPAYWGTYEQFDVLKNFLDNYTNLFLVGRNGMHRYNNQDHSMLSAMTAVELITAQSKDKKILWQVNAEKEYHETKAHASQ